MASRTTIYLPDAVEEVLGPDQAEGRSGRITTILLRYREMVASSTPALTEAEWCAVCDALNGTILDARAGADPLRLLWAEIADADRLDGLGAKWGIDAPALVTRLQEMGYPELVAVAEVVARFWSRTDLPRLEALRQAGARLAE